MVKIPIKDIYIGENRRKVNADKIPQLAESISIVGLLYPVIIQKTSSDQYYLVAGNHRIEAMKYLGFTEIEATVWPEDTNDDLCELAEIDENLQRSGIPWDEEAELHIKRKAIVERMKPSTKAGGDRKSEEFKEKSKPHNADLKTEKCYTQQAAEAVGKSRDTIERAIYIGEHLSLESVTGLKGLLHI
jgi:ParB family chromosome partitioning protein